MLRFSTRDLLWLTLTVAIAMGWYTRERKLRTELDQATELRASATAWRTRAGALERGLLLNGFKTYWDLPWGSVDIEPDGVLSLSAHNSVRLRTDEYEPSFKD